MPASSIHKGLAAAVFCALVPAGAASAKDAAQPAEFKVGYRAYLQRDEAGAVREIDDDDGYTGSIEALRAQESLNHVKAVLTRFDQWRYELGFRTPLLRPAGDTDDPNVFIEIEAYVDPLGPCERGAAGYRPDDKIMVIADSTLEESRDIDFVVAHEAFHGITWPVWGKTMQDEDFLWITEGMADAFAAFYTESAAGINIEETLYRGVAVGTITRSPEYDVPLPKRNTAGSCSGAYDRGHFFYNLGRDGNPGEPWAYLKHVQNIDIDTDREGLDWLDGVIAWAGEKSLWEYFPRFIQRHAATPARYEITAEEMRETFEPRDPGDSFIFPGEAERLAATPYLHEVSFPARPAWREPPDPDRLYAVVQRFEKIDEPEAMAQVIDRKDPIRREPFRRVVSATAGLSYSWFTRLTNVAREPEDTKVQDYELEQHLAFVPLDIPGCVTAGLEYEVLPRGGIPAREWVNSFAEDETRWRVSAGRSEGHRLFAPDRPGEVELTLLVRHDDGFGALEFGRIDITEDACLVRMTSDGAPYRAVFSIGGHTEIIAQGRSMIVDPPYAYIQDRGWKRMDLRDFDRMMGLFGGGGLIGGMLGGLAGGVGMPFADSALGSVAESADVDFGAETGGSAAALSFNLPPVLLKLFDHDRLAPLGAVEDSGVRLSQADCLEERGTCPRITMEEAGRRIQLDYDQRKRLLRVRGGGETHHFDYGDFDLKPVPTRFQPIGFRP